MSATITVSSDAAELFAKQKSTLELLSGVGVRDSTLQNTVREAVFAEGVGWETLEQNTSEIDDATFSVMSEYIRVLMPRKTLPNLCAWFQQRNAGDRHHLGKVRVGDQIDIFPDSDAERVWCEQAIAKNAGHKKKQSQRDKEKAQKTGGKKGQKPSTKSSEPTQATTNTLTFSLPDKTPIASDAPKDSRMKKVFQALDHLKIPYEMVEHPPVPTVEDMMLHLGSQKGGKCKNLFLKASKPLSFWFIAALHDTKVDIKGLSKSVGSKKPMRFASLDLTSKMLGGNKGDLSPFCLLNDIEGKVNVALDSKILEQNEGVWFHPLTNEASIRISPTNLVRFVEATGHSIRMI